MVVGLHILTGLYGPEFWDKSVFSAVGLSERSYLLPGVLHIKVLQLKHLFLLTGILGLGFNIIGASLNVIAARRRKNEPLAPALAGLVPFFISSAITTTFAYLNPSIVNQACIPFMLFIGTLLAYSVGLMITAHVTHAEFPYFTPYFLLIPTIVAIICDNRIGPREAEIVVWLSLGISVGVYGSFVVDVIADITSHLDIWCLTIKHPQGDAKKSQ